MKMIKATPLVILLSFLLYVVSGRVIFLGERSGLSLWVGNLCPLPLKFPQFFLLLY